MTPSPTVSIVIDNHDYGRFLPSAIDSALVQTARDVEVVVVDDGSTDESRDVIARYGDRIVPVLKDNGGQASALNAGFARSAGEIVIFLDADDCLLPDAAARATACFCDPGVVKAHWPMRVIDEAGRPSGHLHPDDPLPDGDRREHLLRVGPTTEVSPPMSGNAWSRRLLERVLPVPEDVYRISADKHLLELAPFLGVVRAIPEPLGLYRRHEASSQLVRDVEERLRLELGFYDSYCEALQRHLAEEGVAVDLDAWRRNSWWHRQQAAIGDFDALPAGPVVLVDEGAWGADRVAGRRCLPFLERDGRYWGSPHDDAVAIAELERMRCAGATCLVFVWSTFWWLDHYHGLRDHLGRHFSCALSNERILAFDLTRQTDAGPPQRSSHE